MAQSSYAIFTDALAQLEQDQSLYEAEIGNGELQGVQHEEIIKLGKNLCKRLKKFAAMGQSFAETLSPDFLTKLTDTIQSYQNLIMPPKIFGGFCPCLKPARSGPEYDKKLLITKAKMVASHFVCHAVIVEDKGEKLNMESMHYADYVNKMNTVFNQLSDIKCTGNEKSLENARKKLVAALEAVEKFIRNFGDSDGRPEFQAEANRRIKAAQELLSSRSNGDGSMPVSKRVLIKAQSSMQEIMNSAAAISLTKAREQLDILDALSKELKKSRDYEVNAFNQMEDSMHENNIVDILHRLREDSEIVHSDASSKLRDAIKRWNSVKGQSSPRKVAEYEEEFEYKPGGGPGELDPSKLLHNTGKTIGSVGKIGTKAAKGSAMAAVGAVTGVAGVVNLMGSEVANFAHTGASGAKSIANTATSGAKQAVKKGTALFGAEEPPPQAQTPKKKGFDMFNPLGSDTESSASKPKGITSMFDGF